LPTTQSKQQDKADGWKRVTADGQLDFLFCTNATCQVVVDLQSVSNASNGHSTQHVHAFSMSGLKGWFSTGLGTIQPSAASLGVAQGSEYLAPELAGADIAVTEVAWSFPTIDMVWPGSSDLVVVIGANKPPGVMVWPMTTTAKVAMDTLLQNLDSLRVRHFKASRLLCGKSDIDCFRRRGFNHQKAIASP
jgi:hypothetical protein